MLLYRSLVSLLALVITLSHCVFASAEYHEDLFLRPLPRSFLLASFSFDLNSPVAQFDSRNFRFFPRSLAEILQHARAKELHLRFSSGRWDYDSWSSQPRGGIQEGGTGVELWAWVEADSVEQSMSRWLTLTNALSGLFCASLNFIDHTRTLRPVMTFEPQGNLFNSSTPNMHLLHGTLPGEVVCTENLTPFLKLLPCKGKSGISTLLHGHKLFDSAWQSMAIDVRYVCKGKNRDCQIEMDQSVDMVLDIERAKRTRNNPIPKPPRLEDLVCSEATYYKAWPDTCFPLPSPQSPAFNLSDVFGRSLTGACPYADQHRQGSEPMCLDVPEQLPVHINTNGKFTERKRGKLRCYTLPEDDTFDFALEQQDVVALDPDPQSQPLLRAERTLTGYGQQHGGIRILLSNLDSNEDMLISYFEPLPWSMRVFTHTLKATLPGGAGNPGLANGQHTIQKMIHRPAVDRKGAGHLEMLINIPAGTTLTLTYDFEKSTLRYSEYPPDANRGFNVAAAVARVLSPSPKHAATRYVRTTSLLLYLPTPDFSMPYNVIILSSTVIALAFGNIFNLLVRRFVAADEASPSGGRLRQLVRRQVAKLKARLAASKKKKE